MHNNSCSSGGAHHKPHRSFGKASQLHCTLFQHFNLKTLPSDLPLSPHAACVHFLKISFPMPCLQHPLLFHHCYSGHCASGACAGIYSLHHLCSAALICAADPAAAGVPGPTHAGACRCPGLRPSRDSICAGVRSFAAPLEPRCCSCGGGGGRGQRSGVKDVRICLGVAVAAAGAVDIAGLLGVVVPQVLEARTLIHQLCIGWQVILAEGALADLLNIQLQVKHSETYCNWRFYLHLPLHLPKIPLHHGGKGLAAIFLGLFFNVYAPLQRHVIRTSQGNSMPPASEAGRSHSKHLCCGHFHSLIAASACDAPLQVSEDVTAYPSKIMPQQSFHVHSIKNKSSGLPLICHASQQHQNSSGPHS